MSLEDYRYKVSALNKASAPYEKGSKSGSGIPSVISKNKKYVIIVVGIFLLLVLFKPKIIQGKIIGNEGEKPKANGKINMSSLVKYWIIFSLVFCILLYIYCNIICKKKGLESSSCKRCSGS